MANNDYRTSQLVFPFGVGAIIDFKNNTYMSAGLNFWPSETKQDPFKSAILENTQIVDPRLQIKLSSMNIHGQRRIKYFLQPTEKPDFSAGKPAEHQERMPFVRFPLWHFCSNCKRLKKARLEDKEAPICHGRMLPVTFLIACEHGHISDFPFIEWVHRDTECTNPEMYLKSNSNPGLPGIIIECKTCRKSRNLAGVYPKPYERLNSILPRGCCPGERPWLGSSSTPEECNLNVDFIQRASSSTYFPHTISSILIPPFSESVRRLIDKPAIWEMISRIMERMKVEERDGVSVFNEEGLEERLSDNMTRYTNVYPLQNIIEAAKKKYAEINDQNFNQNIDDISFRKKEYLAFLGERPVAQDRKDFDIDKQDISSYDDRIQSYLSNVVLVTKLRETRVLTGFSRIKPLSSGDEKVSMHEDGKPVDWLPAIEVRGEGIFLQFKKETLHNWYINNQNIIDEYLSYFNSWLARTKNKNDKNYARIIDIEKLNHISPYFILIHTFSHIFIKQLVYESGYDSSSLRERLFVSDDIQQDNEMYGLLIYTSSGDSEGTLGGLVELGKPGKLEEVFLNSLRFETCSNDPVCLETERQGLNNLNGASCHGCCLLPETSCEHNNTLLDRKFLFGSSENPKIGFLSELLDTLYV